MIRLTLLSLMALLAPLAYGQWSSTPISIIKGVPSQPENMASDIAVSSDGSSIHVVWQSTNGSDSAIYYKRSINGGLSWQPDYRLSPIAPANDNRYAMACTVSYSYADAPVLMLLFLETTCTCHFTEALAA